MARFKYIPVQKYQGGLKSTKTSYYVSVNEPDYEIKIGIKDGEVVSIDWNEMVQYNLAIKKYEAIIFFPFP